MMKRSAIFLLAFCACVTGKAEKRNALPPVASPNYVIVEKARSEVWSKGIPRLGQRFFVINNLDVTSGLINVSYSGDPEKYVDGGEITSWVENARGKRTYSFPAAKGHYQYELAENGRLFAVTRDMELEGRVNIIVEELAQSKTKVTANVRYVLTRKISEFDFANNRPSQRAPETAAFNSGEPGHFASNRAEDLYWPTGRLESEILSAFAP
jgi:hypothetical protein